MADEILRYQQEASEAVSSLYHTFLNVNLNILLFLGEAG